MTVTLMAECLAVWLVGPSVSSQYVNLRSVHISSLKWKPLALVHMCMCVCKREGEFLGIPEFCMI